MYCIITKVKMIGFCDCDLVFKVPSLKYPRDVHFIEAFLKNEVTWCARFIQFTVVRYSVLS